MSQFVPPNASVKPDANIPLGLVLLVFCVSPAWFVSIHSYPRPYQEQQSTTDTRRSGTETRW